MAVEVEASSEKETGITFTDPNEYWQSFLGSDEYEDAVEERTAIIAKNRGEKRTRAIKDEARKYLLSRPELLQDALYKYSRDGRKLVFDESSSVWSPKMRVCLNNYWQSIRNMNRRAMRENLTNDEIHDMDIDRMNKHTRASMQMTKEGLAPSDSIGRFMIEAMTEAKGLGGIDPREDERRQAAYAETSRHVER